MKNIQDCRLLQSWLAPKGLRYISRDFRTEFLDRKIRRWQNIENCQITQGNHNVSPLIIKTILLRPFD